MGSGIVTPLLIAHQNTTGQTRFLQTNSNLQLNGILIDVKATVKENGFTSWDFLKKIFLDVTMRSGFGNGTSIPMCNGLSLYDAMAFSDVVSGVSMESAEQLGFEVGETVRISGYLPIGFYKMDARDALEVQLQSSELPIQDFDVVVSSVYEGVSEPKILGYQTSTPTGADQPYKNVLALYYVGTDTIAQGQASITDMIGTKQVTIEDAIALTNATGRLEFFTRIGQLYADEFEISQDLSFRLPNGITGDVLVVQEFFFPEILESTVLIVDSNESAILEQVKQNEPDKYKYLKLTGRA